MTAQATQDFALAFLSILFEGAPFILLGTLVSGLVDVYLPAGTMDRFLPKNGILAIMAAGLLGAVFPVCECAVVPVIRRLVAKGLPVSCALTYMLAAPIVNPITALSTWHAFYGQGGAKMVVARLVLGYLTAVAVGVIVSRIKLSQVLKTTLLQNLTHHPKVAHSHGPSCSHHPATPAARRLAALRSSMLDFVDVAAYFTVGVIITALFNTGIAPGAEWLDGVAGSALGAPMALMGLAFVLSLCSTSDAFIAATLDQFTWGAKLAFLVFGPMMDIKLLFLYQTVLRKRFILFLAIFLFIVIGTAAVAWQEIILNRP